MDSCASYDYESADKSTEPFSYMTDAPRNELNEIRDNQVKKLQQMFSSKAATGIKSLY